MIPNECIIHSICRDLFKKTYPVVSNILLIVLQRAMSVIHFGFPVSPNSAYSVVLLHTNIANYIILTLRVRRGLKSCDQKHTTPSCMYNTGKILLLCTCPCFTSLQVTIIPSFRCDTLQIESLCGLCVMVSAGSLNST